MTIDEAIKDCEEVADANERLCETIRPAMQLADYGKRGTVRRQLAEWLKELKESRMALDILAQFIVDTNSDACCKDLMNNEKEKKVCEKYCTFETRGCWIRWAKMKAKEVLDCKDCEYYTDAEEIHGVTPCGGCGVDRKNFKQKRQQA